VLLTTAGGTTQTLQSHIALGRNGTSALTAADGTTRTNFASVSIGVPVANLVLEDTTEDSWGMMPYPGPSVSTDLYGTDRAGACKFVLLSSQTFDGVSAYVSRNGTPVGVLRARILDSSNNLITGTSVSLDIDLLLASGNRDTDFYFNDPVTLPAGTYRVVIDSTDSANSSNCWRVLSLDRWSATASGAQFLLSSTTNMSTTFTWTDDTDSVPLIHLFHSVDVAPSTNSKAPGSLSGGMQ
jgi:hypothetical protein